MDLTGVDELADIPAEDLREADVDEEATSIRGVLVSSLGGPSVEGRPTPNFVAPPQPMRRQVIEVESDDDDDVPMIY